jgi:hypothetical protein
MKLVLTAQEELVSDSLGDESDVADKLQTMWGSSSECENRLLP